MTDRLGLVGPGSVVTLPGLFSHSLARKLSERVAIDRIAIDTSLVGVVGLFRARPVGVDDADMRATPPAPATTRKIGVVRHGGGMLDGFPPDTRGLVLLVWPSLVNGWVSGTVRAARNRGLPVIAICCSLPNSSVTSQLSRRTLTALSGVSTIITGAEADAHTISTSVSSSTRVRMHPALCLGDYPNSAPTANQADASISITAFIDVGGIDALRAIVDGFDSISESVIHRYQLRFVMASVDDELPARSIASAAHHSAQIYLDVGPKTPDQVEAVARASSIVITSNLVSQSPAVRGAVEGGIGLIVMTEPSNSGSIGHYIGAVSAIKSSVASLHVAIEHSVRRRGLHFPSDDALQSLADELTILVPPTG
jgi:hypothetical protein